MSDLVILLSGGAGLIFLCFCYPGVGLLFNLAVFLFSWIQGEGDGDEEIAIKGRNVPGYLAVASWRLS